LTFINKPYPFFFRLFITLALVIFSSALFSQNNNSIYGKVIDQQTKEPLAFVNILVNKDNQVSQTDIDGIFRITFRTKIDSLQFSYVGYETYVYKVLNKTKNLIIELKKKQFILNEVIVFPGENPAHRIINKVIENRDKNNPEKMNSFSYTSYNKMVFTIPVDSLNKDSLHNDSEFIKIKKIFKKQDLFLMESVTERKFMYPDKNNEKLIASKISGLKDPLLSLLFSQIQSFSFYNEIIHLLDKNYLNPISKRSSNKYFFLLEDTLYQGKDSVYVISYKPHRNQNFDGLKGLLYINTNGYAIQDVIAYPAMEEKNGLAVKIQQKYELIDNKQWFPVQLNSDLTFNTVSINNIKIIGQGKSYLKDIVLNPVFNKSEFSNVEIEATITSTDQNDKIWKAYRTDSLSEKDKRTYRSIDSLGKIANLDRTMRTFETLMSGKIPVKCVDIDLNRLIRFNDHEGWRLGLGIHNNYKISKTFVAGGYLAYGLKDKASKYGGDFAFNIPKTPDVSVGVLYFNDVTESGGIGFYEPIGFMSDSYLRRYLIKRMDKTEKKEFSVKFTAFNYLKADINFSLSAKSVTNDYFYGIHNENVSMLINDYNFTEFGVNLCYSYKEKFIKTSRGKISEGTKYPIIYFNYIKGFNNFLDGEYSYNKYEFKIKKTFFLKNLGSPSFQFQAGYIDGDLPYCNLYNGIGSYRMFTVEAPNSFTTMRMNEFLSNRYAALFLTHSFGKLLFRTKKFSPEIALATNLCIGDLNNPSKHFNIDIRTLSKGYIESGILVNKIINTGFYGIGVGAYYRYGYYSLPAFKDNIALKFTLTF
jgi:hypothetical protein